MTGGESFAALSLCPTYLSLVWYEVSLLTVLLCQQSMYRNYLQKVRINPMGVSHTLEELSSLDHDIAKEL